MQDRKELMAICTLTPNAVDQINALCSDNSVYGVGLDLKGGGCAGFEYEWRLVEKVEDIKSTDEVISCDKGHLVIGMESVMYLFGSVIDYKKDIIGAMFDIKNPNAQSACGCGVSVNFDLDKVEQNAKITELT